MVSVGARYLRVLRMPSVGRLAGAASISRLTTSMLSLSLFLAVVDIRGSYADAGAVLFTHAMALALAAPLGGRLADRFGHKPVLLLGLALHVLAYLGLMIAFLEEYSLIGLLGISALLGGSTPPAGAVLRRTWPLVVPEGELSVAYAIDTVINSSTFILGPLLVGSLILICPAGFVVGLGAIAKVIGDLALALTINSRQARLQPERSWGLFFGSLRNGSLLLLLGVIAMDTFVIGVVQVGTAVSAGAGATSGIMLSAFASGEVLGGLLYGARTWAGSIRGQFLVLHLATAGVLISMSTSFAFWGLVALCFFAGLFSGARDALGQIAVSMTSQPAHRTEAFGWLTSFMWAGYGLGTLMSGWLSAEWGQRHVFLIGAGASLTAAAAVLALRSITTTAQTAREDT